MRKDWFRIFYLIIYILDFFQKTHRKNYSHKCSLTKPFNSILNENQSERSIDLAFLKKNSLKKTW